MGKKLDAILGRTFKASKFKAVANLAISRIAILKNQRQVMCNQAQSDVVQLLQQGHHDRALLRVEHVIKEQKMLDVCVMLEGYCNLLIERVHLIEQERVCPDELKEAISGLLFASTRCGDFPELQEIRAIFTSWYGKEFAARAIELRNNCGVSPKIIQKLSTRQPDLESRMKVLKEIASENSIVLQPEETASGSTEEKLDASKKQNQPEPDTSTNSGSTKLFDNLHISPEEIENDGFSASAKARKKYRDVADAAQAAFESAAHAAAAARAAMELSRSDPHDPDTQDSLNNRGREVSDKDVPIKNESESANQAIHHKNEVSELKAKSQAQLKRSVSTSSSDSAEDDLKVPTVSLDVEDPAKQLEKDIVFYESDNDTDNLGSNIKPSRLKGEVLATENSNKQIPSIIQAGTKGDSRQGYSGATAAEGSEIQSSQRLNIEKGPISVRTRRVRGF